MGARAIRSFVVAPHQREDSAVEAQQGAIEKEGKG